MKKPLAGEGAAAEEVRDCRRQKFLHDESGAGKWAGRRPAPSNKWAEAAENQQMDTNCRGVEADTWKYMTLTPEGHKGAFGTSV